MVFNSLIFWLVFPCIFAIYWLIPSGSNALRKFFLVLASYGLYMCWKPSFAILLAGLTLFTYLGARLIQANENKRSVLSWTFVVIGLLPLIVFKYCGFHWMVPIGISFYTFQAVGYLLDVYHRRILAEENILNYSLFICFFPQITSGPISTANDLMPQIRQARSFDFSMAVEGMKMVLWGMFLKVVLADRIGIYVDTVYANYSHLPGSVCFLASLLYTIQIYCDFAGYSLMAVGLARSLGFVLIDNFRRPYFAASVTEFWHRWHISLTRWLTTHVYINLGGNRCSKFRQYFNILVTFLVSGIWHGCNWTFVIWGGIHGILQIIERSLFAERLKSELKRQHPLSPTRVCRILLTFNLVSIAWIFFRMPTLHDAFSMIARFVTDFGTFTIAPMDTKSLVCLAMSIPLLAAYDLLHEYCADNRLLRSRPLQCAFYVLVACMILSVGVLDASQFIYVSF